MKTIIHTLIIFFASWTAYSQSLLPNGTFDQPDPSNPAKPAKWELPDGLAVQYATADSAHGKAIRMDTSLTETAVVESYQKAGLTDWVFPNPKANTIAETYGLSLYSEPIPIHSGKAYKVTFDFMSEKGTQGKVWFRGYKELDGGKLKRIYEGVTSCSSPKGEWQTFSGVFRPTKNTPAVTKIKVMLFVYYPPGVSWYDNVKVEEVDEPVATAPTTPANN